MYNVNWIVVGTLSVLVFVLGFLYYQEASDNVDVKIDLPNVKIDGR